MSVWSAETARTAQAGCAALPARMLAGALTGVLLGVVLSGCGQKGPLYLPTPQKTSVPANAPAPPPPVAPSATPQDTPPATAPSSTDTAPAAHADIGPTLIAPLA